MATDWINMRTSLATHAGTLQIAELLMDSEEAAQALLLPDVVRNVTSNVTDNVTRNASNVTLRYAVVPRVVLDVTLASLMRVWTAVNQHAKDGVWFNLSLSTLDQIAGVPGFGKAMEAAGWAVFDEVDKCVEFPDFIKHNETKKEKYLADNAARQARYRERKREKSNVTDNVTSNVTRNVTNVVHKDENDLTNGGEKVTLRNVTRNAEGSDGTLLIALSSLELSPDQKQKSKSSKSTAREKFELPGWFPPEAIETWEAYLRMRQRIRKPATAEAKTLCLRKLEQFAMQGHNVQAVLEQSIENSWQGLFALKNPVYGRRGAVEARNAESADAWAAGPLTSQGKLLNG